MKEKGRVGRKKMMNKKLEEILERIVYSPEHSLLSS